MTFVLTHFQFDPHAELLNYTGYSFFEPLQSADPQVLLKWQEERAQAYQGSVQHLLQALLEDRTFEEGFLLFEDDLSAPRGPGFSSTFERKPARREDFLKPIDDGSFILNFNRDLRVVYRRKRARYKHTKDRSPEEQTSWIRMAFRPATLHKDGSIFPTNALHIFGYIGQKRIGDLLPREYFSKH